MTAPRSVRTSTGALLVVVLAALGLVIVAGHTTPTGYRGRPGSVHEFVRGRAPTAPPPPSASDTGSVHLPHAGVLTGPAVLLVILELAAAAALLVALVAWLLRVRLRRRRRGVGLGREPTQLLATRLSAAAEEGLVDLKGGEVDDAIILCWLRLHDAVVDAGVRPKPSDSPADFVKRVLAQESVRVEPLGDLAELFREARFSRHAMTESDRTDAVRALLAIRADLAAAHE